MHSNLKETLEVLRKCHGSVLTDYHFVESRQCNVRRHGNVVVNATALRCTPASFITGIQVCPKWCNDPINLYTIVPPCGVSVGRSGVVANTPSPAGALCTAVPLTRYLSRKRFRSVN